MDNTQQSLTAVDQRTGEVIPLQNNGLFMTAVEVKRQVQLIQQVMKEVMQEGVHYGKVPGCGDKPTLLKAGAEKVAMTFRLAPSFHINRTDLGDGHREYEVRCTITHAVTGQVLGEGVGSCSTMEKKYRYRKVTGSDGKPKQAENPDLADTYNTVLKMAKKRAQVDATLTVTAASDIFTQDLEDMDFGRQQTEKPPVQQPQRASSQPPAAAQAPGSNPPPPAAPPRSGEVISEAQAKRLFAIAMNGGYSKDQLRDELARRGYQSSKDILKEDYNEIVAHFSGGA